MRGFWYTVEAIIAGLLIITFLTILGTINLTQPQQGDPQVLVLKTLRDLDDRGLLRGYAANNNYAGLNNAVAIAAYNHTIQICDFNSGCAGIVPTARNVWVGSYFIAGDDLVSGNGVFAPREVRLFLWQ